MVKLNIENLGFSFTNGEEELFFPLKLVNRRNMTIKNQTTLLNSYFEYKGKIWYDEFFAILKDVYNEITFSTSSKVLAEIPSLNTLITYLDINDMKKYLTEIYKIKIPKNLIASFTDDMRAEGRWNEEQTYTIDDYVELAAETLRLKILLGPICYYVYLNASKMNKDLMEYVSVRIHLKQILETSNALSKVIKSVTKLISTIDKEVVIIEKKLPEEELCKYVTYIAMIQRMATATIIDDTETLNIIIDVYAYSKNKLGISGDISKMVRPKIIVSNDDASGGAESASVFESFKTVTLTTLGESIQPLWATEDIDTVIHNSPNVIGLNVDKEEVIKIRSVIAEFFRDPAISDFSEKIIKLIFGNTINQSSVGTLKLENMFNLLAVGHVYLKNIGYPNIADLLISREVEFTEISYRPRDKKDKMLMAELNAITFGDGEDKNINVLMEILNSANWVSPTGPVEIEKEIVNNLAKLFISQSKILYTKE